MTCTMTKPIICSRRYSPVRGQMCLLKIASIYGNFTSSVDVRWTSLKDKLLQATKQVCGVSSNQPWRKQTWWWNNQVEEAVREKRRCFKLWKAGGSRAAYNTAKRTSNRVVHQAKSEAEKVALQKIDARSGDVIDLPSKCVVTIRMSWERNLLRMMQASCR